MKRTVLVFLICAFVAFLTSNIAAQEPIDPDCENVFANAGPSEDGKPLDETADPVVIANGDLVADETDFMIQAKGLIPLEITRTYNSQSPSDLDDWQPVRGAGTWKVLDGVYTGHGDRSATSAVYGAFTLSARMKTITAGTNEPWMTARINFRYSQADGGPLNTYYVLIDQNSKLEFARVINDVYYVQSKQTSYNPFNWNTIEVEANYSTIKVYVNGNLEFDVSSNPALQIGHIALEACFSHCHFDDIVITPSGQSAITYDFNNPDSEEPFGMNWTYTYGMSLKERVLGNVTITGADGGRTTYTKDGASYISPKGVYSELSKNETGFTLREKDGTIYRFDISGRLSYIEDRFGNRNTLYYENISGKERVKYVRDASNRALTFNYTSDGKVTSINDPKGNTYQYIYNENQLVQVIDPRGNSKYYEYDLVNKVRSKYINRKGDVYEYSYTPYNLKVKTQKDPEGNYTTFDYFWDVTHVTNKYNETWYYRFYPDSNLFRDLTDNIGSVTNKWWNDNNQLMRVEDEYGRVTVYEDETHKYDGNGNTTYIKDPMLNETFFSYNPAYSLIEWKKDASGNETNYTYDTSGKLLRIDEPLGKVTLMDYYNYGKLQKITDAEGNITEYEYDVNGYCAKIRYYTETGFNEKTFVYDIIGNLLSETDEEGNTTNYIYDANSNLIEVRDGSNNLLISYTYDKNDNLQSMTDSLSHTVYYEYDWAGNLIKTTEYDENNVPHVIEYVYDNVDYLHLGKSRLVSAKDQNGNITTYQYTNTYKVGVLKTVTDAEGRQTKYKYDLVGNLQYIEDSAGQKTVHQFNHNDQIWLITYPNNSSEEFHYTPVGKLDNKRNRKWQTITYQYDALNRLTSKVYPNATRIDYTYDKVNNLIGVTSPNGTTSMTYDKRARMKTATYPSGKAISYEYYKNGLRKKLTYPDSSFITYTYDSLNRLTDIKDSSGAVIAHYDYDGLSLRRNALTYMNGASIEYGHDVLDRVKSVRNKLPSAAIFSQFDYTHDKVGNRLTMTSNEGLHQYYYDKTYQLIDATYPDLRMSHYEYDVMGNRVYIDDRGEHSDYSLKANGLNQYDLISKTSHNIDIKGTVAGEDPTVTVGSVDAIVSGEDFLAEDVTLSDGTNLILAEVTDDTGTDSDSISLTLDTSYSKTFSYDNNGSLTQVNFKNKQVIYAYDYDNRLASLTQTDGPDATYKYDYLGRRIEKNVAGVITRYIYDGDNVIAEYDSTDTLIAKYIYGPNIDEPIRLEKGANICYYHYDALGSVTDLSNSSGQHIEHYYYGPFGNTRIYDPATGLKRQDSITANPYRFTARRWDNESNLYFYRARMYDPKLGRFLQADPIGYDADVTLYRYCRNNPVNFIDPYGLDVYVGFEGPSGANPFGHSYIRIDNDTYEAGRRDSSSGKDNINHTNYDDYMKNHATPGHGEQKIPMSKSQEQRLRNNLNDSAGKPFPYSAPFNNCADFVEDQLKDVGVDLPRDLIDFPADTFDEAEDYRKNNEGK